MPLDALLLALAAAFLHAFWNLLIARAKDPEAATAVALLVALVAYAPVAALTWRIEPAAIPYIVVTSFLQLGYVILLAAAYVRAELSVVYPIARGTAPVLVLVVGVTALGLGTSAQQAAGVCLVGMGVLLVRGLRRSAEPAGVLFGLAIACFIAAYTLVDKYGIRYAAPFVYLELSMLLSGLGYSAAIVRLRGRPALRAEWGWATVAAGLATFGSKLQEAGVDFDPTKYQFGIYGIIIVLMMLFRPEGLIPERRHKRELELGVHDTPFYDVTHEGTLTDRDPEND